MSEDAKDSVSKLLSSLPPERLALVMQRLKKSKQNAGGGAIVPVDRGQPIRLSFAQQRLWFLNELDPNSATYNEFAAVRLIGRLDRDVFRRSLNALVQRHETLRTTFGIEGGEPVQVIAPDGEAALRIVDARSEAPERAIARAAREEAQTPFDLGVGPLLRAVLVQLGPEQHALILTMHHIVSDAWSTAVLVRELAELYRAFLGNAPPRLPALTIQYADYAAWQRDWLTGEVLEKQVGYWRKQLAGSPRLLELPTDRPRPANQTFSGRRHPVSVSKELTEQLRKLSREEGATLFMTLLAGFQVLLGHYSRQRDVVVGTPVTNRTRVETEGLIGFFLNTLAMRTDLDGDPTVRELIGRVRATALGAFDHQDVPFEKVVEELSPERSLSFSPLFQVMFTLQGAPAKGAALSGLELEPMEVESGIARFDLTLNLREHEEGLAGGVDYNTALFDEESIARMMGHLERLLEGMAARPAARLSTLSMLSPQERRQILVEWNDTATAYPKDRWIHELFEAQASSTPEAIALVFEGQQLTYRALDARSNQLGHYLRKRGVGPDVLVAICVERSLEMVVGLLGILKAGGAYVPLDPAYPKERLAFMLEDSRAKLLLTEEQLRSSEVAEESVAPLRSGASGKNLAYMIYTSGSTGRPKGAMNSHEGILNRLQWMQAAYRLTEHDRVLQKTPFSFDVSVWEFFWPLMTGSRLVVAKPGGHQDPTYLARLIADERITTLHFVPSMLAVFLEEPELAERCRSVRQVMCSGEALPLELQERLFSLLPTIALHNLYGPTEAAVDVTSWACQPGARRSVPIGRPIANIRMHVLDEAHGPVPAGVAGELYIGGVGLARGYLGRPELTAEKFVPDPYGQGARLYRTGDLGRYLPDGTIEYLGRIDQQVKIRGFRIELGEVEIALGAHPMVREVVVLAREDVPGDKRLVAYVTSRGDTTPTAEALRAHLEKTLPEHMVPSAFVPLAALPLSPNGKVDRKALPPPDGAQLGPENEYVPPRTDGEKELAAIWAELLRVDRVGIDDNFFGLGGDSILSIKVVARARERGVELTVKQIFERPTLRALAQAPGDPETQLISTPPFGLIAAEDRAKCPDDIEDAYPLSKLQSGMLFHGEYAGGSAVYHDVFSFHLRAAFDEPRLNAALAALAMAHPVLRTSFDFATYREPLQLVHRHAVIPLTVDDLRGRAVASQEEVIAAWIDQEKRQTFAWKSAPLLRVHLHRRSEETLQLSLSFHHAILDGWSVASLMTELFEQYLGRMSGGRVVALAKPMSELRDFVAQERLALASEATKRFWADRLEGATTQLLPRTGPETGSQVRDVRNHDVELADEVIAGLKRVVAKAGAPLKSAFLAAHLRVMHLLAGGHGDVLTGLVANGRPESRDGERVLGLFLNTLPFRQRLRPCSWLDLVTQTFQSERALLEHRRYPLAQLQLDQGRVELFETAFNYVHFHVYERLKDSAVEVLGGRFFEQTNFALVANFSPGTTEARAALWLAFDPTHISDEQVARYGRYYQRVLVEMATRPDGAWDAVSPLGQQERRQLLVEWNDTARVAAEDECIHALFEAQAQRSPFAIALEHGETRVSYRELDERTNQIARLLRETEVVRGARVGILIERSIAMVEAMVGVMKSGASYVPLDPAWPAERVVGILARLEIRTLVVGTSKRGQLAAMSAQLPSLRTVLLLADGADADLEGPPAVRLLTPKDVARQSVDRLAAVSDAEDEAYVIHTSGSTGEPKGVVLEHRPVVNLIRWVNETFEVGPGDRLLFVTSICFDLSVYDVFGILAAGATIRLAGSEVLADPEQLVRQLCEGEITFWDSAPAALQQLAPLLPKQSQKSPLRLVFLSGDWIPLGLPDHIRAVFPRAEVVSLGGATEAAIWSNYYPVNEVEPSWRSIPYGRPIWNARYYVLDAHLEPAPVGVTGDLYIGGRCLAEGYARDPILTAGKFLPDPFDPEPGRRMYRTGDLARFWEDGNIEFLGRSDSQVKVRGYRIELGEIEKALAALDGVQTGLVVALGERSERRLVAYVVLAAGARWSPAQLREALEKRLPEYMVPSAFVFLDALPVTPNGKVDRKALPAPEGTQLASEQDYVAPRTEIERKLTALWAELLRVERVGIHDDFFELGGDSILSIQVISRAREAGLQLTPKQLFEHPTAAELAQVAGTVATVVAEQGLVSGEVELTPIAKWFFEQEPAEAHHFNQAVLLEPRRPLDPATLKAAMAALLAHHDALRLRFERGEGRWRSRNEAAIVGEAWFDHIDLATVPDDAQRARIAAEGARLQGSLDLGSGALVRVALFESGKKQRVLLAIHHLAVDGVSWRVLLEDLERAYGQKTRGEPISLPPKTASFQAWARLLSAHGTTARAEDELPYWLGPATETRLPLDHDGGTNLEEHTRTITVALSEGETEALLKEVPFAYRTKINDALLTAVVIAFAGWTGRSGLRIDLEGHGRDELFEGIDISRTVGWFTSLYPVELDIGHGGVGEALKAVKEQLRRVPGNGAGYGLLRYLGRDEVRAKLAAQPSAEVSFNYLGQLDQALRQDSLFAAADEGTGPAHSPKQKRAHLIEIDGSVQGGTLRMAFSYGDKVHRHETIERLATRFLASLRELIAHCRSDEAGGYTPSDFPLAGLGQGQLDELLGRDRQVEDVYPLSPMQQGMFFHALYETQSKAYFEQMAGTLRGGLDVEAFERAWQQVVDRHEVLRTAFYWEGLERPLQVVRAGARIAVEQADWRGLSRQEQARRYDAHLEDERRRGFDLQRAPLMRLWLAQTAEQELRFVWSYHHLLLDGWCLPIVLKEVLKGYEAQLRGERIELGPSRPYRDYIAWLGKQDLAQAEAYFRKVLAGFTAPTPLGVDRTVAPREAGYGEAAGQLSEKATAGLKAMARGAQLTLNTMVQGAWALLLSRYSREADVVFGSTVSGRPAAIPGVESMVGLFINTLPVRVAVSGEEKVAEWLKALQARQVEARQYEHSPLVEVQGWSEVPSGQPLFESLVVFENYPVDQSLREQPGSLRFEDVRAVEQTNYPLTVIGVPGDALALRISYDRGRFDPKAVERMVGHLSRLLEEMAARPEARLSQLAILTEAERRLLLVEWNDTASDHPKDRCIHELFEAQALRTPEAVAVVFEGKQLTYRELNERSNQLGHHLRKRGVGPDVLVAICVERSLEMVVGLLGILKAGGAYVPLDPAYPKERLGFTLEDAAVKLLITQERLRAELSSHEAELVCLDSDWEKIGREPSTSVRTEAHAENLAYVIYTSGSTGRPKGVAIAHRSAAVFLGWTKDTWSDREAAGTLGATSICFDLSVFEIFGTLTRGAKLILAENALGLATLMAEDAVTLVNTVPSAIAELLRTDGIPTTVKTVNLAGEPLSDVLVQGLYERGVERVFDLYGPSEDTTYSTCALRKQGPGSVVTVGRPIANTQVYLLDAELAAVPLGVPGEVFIGGDGLARGYLYHPALTAEKFIPNPFGTTPGARLYRTGDLARYLADGSIEYLGRIDHQVKIRGFRIELGEVESALGGHPEIREVVVLAREDVPGAKRLVAYVTARGAAAPTVEALRAHLRQTLPEYMVPSAFVVLEALPLLPNGKVDRKALPAPEGAQLGPAKDYVASRTAAERALTKLWAELLRVERVGIHDNFFELGGDSILSIQVVSRAREAGLRLTPKLLFEHPTVAGLAEVAGTVATVEAEQGLVRGEVELTPIAKWFFEQALTDAHHFNQSLLLEVRQPLDAQALKEAVAALMAHHDALRLRFDRAEGEWRPRNEGEVVDQAWFEQIDLGAVPDDAQPQRIAAEGARLQASLDLGKGPLLRVALFDLDKGQRLQVVIHHLAVDGVSWRVLLEDLERAYRQRVRGEQVALPAKTTSFQAWAGRLAAYGRTEAAEKELDYWLEPASETRLPVDYSEGANLEEHARTVTIELSDEDTDALLKEVPATYRTKVNDALLTAVVKAFAGWTGKSGLRIDLEGHGREELFEGIDVSRTVGWFTSLYPVELDIGHEGIGAALKAVKEQLRAVPSNGIGYGLLKYLGREEVRAKLEHRPNAQVSFNYLGQLDQALRPDSLFGAAREGGGPEHSPRQQRARLIDINGGVQQGRLWMAFSYSERVHRRATMQQLAERFLAALKELIAHCRSEEAGGYTPSDFSGASLSQDELDALLSGDEP